MRLHLDTDIGANVDDLAALVMVLGSPEAELTGVTTCADPDGDRAGLVGEVLRMAGRAEVPVEPGCSPAAVHLLDRSIAEGASVIALGPATNLGRLARIHPEALARARVVMMGGWFGPTGDGLPAWGPERDSNVQADPVAAREVLERSERFTLVPLSLTLRVHLCRSHLRRLRSSGPLGDLVADAAEQQSSDRAMAGLARSCAALPDDLLAFQHDPLTVAVGLGWRCVTTGTRRVRPVLHDGVLRFEDDGRGHPVEVATDVCADVFAESWLLAVEAAGRR